jgi:precorrin-3B C17-methyltransferase
MSRRAHEVLSAVDTVAGYNTYIDLIRPLIAGKRIIRTAMTREVERVAAAIDAALQGGSCALVSSGDPGIYAMAGLALEMCRERKISAAAPVPTGAEGSVAADLTVEVVPGIPALSAGAALLGAPLTHDFAAISLSDLLTPWETIARRIEAAAAADFVVVIYNPRSRRRADQLTRARQILLKHRSGRTPVGIVSRAYRDGQNVQIVALEDLQPAEVDMQTTVFVGSSASFRYLDFMVTPRGYGQKYDMKK